MVDAARKTGIGIIGDVPWGTHFCHFYRVKEDLISILVPYFKAGLENNEFCLWATAEPLGAREARKAMEKAMPGLDRYLKTGQIEIVPHDQWYLQDGLFDSERVIRAWVDKLDRALAAGYSGMRASGNISWLERKDWESFAAYESALNRVIGQRQMVVLCAYWMKNISVADTFEVAGSHTFAVIGRNGDLELVEGAFHRKRAEEALRDREKKYRQLIETIHEGIWVIDKDARTTFVNPRMAEMLGYTVEEMVGKHLFAFMDERGVEVAKNRLERRQRGIKEQHDFEFLRKDGTRLYTSLETSPIIDDKGDYAGATAGVQDITERRKAEEELRTSEERYRLLVENATEGIAVIQNGEIVFANSLVMEVIGHSEAGHPFRPIIELIHPDDRQMVMERLLGVQGTQDRPSILSFRIIDKEGNGRWVETNMAPYTWDGRPAALALVTDISERRKAEEALEQHNRLLATTNALATELASLPSREITEAFVAKRLEEMTGASAVWFNEYDPSDRTLVLRHVEIETEVLEKVAQLLGKQPNEVRSPVSEDMYSEIVSSVIGRRETLTEVTFGAIPPSVSAAIQELLGIDHFIGIAYVIEGELYGTSVLAMKAGRPDPARELLESVAYMVAISLRQRRAEDALRASEENNRLLINNAAEGILVLQDEKVVLVNPRYVEIAGFLEEELKSMPFSELVHPDDRQMVTERYLKRLKGEEIPPIYAARVIDKAGNVKWVEANSVLFTWNGRPAILALVTDVTDRKRTEEALRASEKRYRLLFDVIPVVISVTTPEGRALSVNSAIREMSGYTPEEFMTLSMNDIYVDPVERRRMRALLQREGRVRDFETGFRRKDGSISIVLLNADTIELDHQELILATVRDITDRKRVEKDLLQSKALLNETERTGMIGGWAFDAETLTQTWTEETFRILEIDLTKGEPKVPEGIGFIAPEFRPMAEQAIQRAVEYGEPYDQEWEIITAKGNRKWVHSVARVHQEQGKTKSVAGSFQDITERKQAEEALQRQQKHFRALIEKASDAITIAGADGTISYESPSCERMSGFKPEERIGANIVERVHPDDIKLLSDAFSHLIRHPGSTMQDEIRLRHKDGTWLTVETTVTNLLHDPAINGIVVNLRDITERKQTEEALRENHQLLNDTGEMAKVGGWELDLSTNEVFWTEEVGRIHGVGPGYRPKLEEALDFYAPESRSAVEAVVRKAAETGEPYDLESLLIPRGSKDKIWVRSLGKAVYSGGEIVKLAGTFQDIDKYKRAEESLRASETRYRLLAENLSDIIWTMGTDLKYTYISPSVTLLRGYTVEEAMAQPLADNLTPASLETAMKLMVEEEAKERTGQYDPNRSITMEVEVSCKNGSTIWMENRVTYLRDSNGQTTAYLGVSRDITERKRAEETLRESEKLYRTLFDSMPVMVVIATPEGKVLSVNNTIQGLSGYTPEEFMTMNMSDLYVDPSEQKRMLSLLQEEGRVSDFEVMFRLKDGLTAHVLLNVDKFELDGQKLIMTTVRDITGLKKAEIRQRRTQEQLILASRLASLGRLASGVAHEINNPLAVVMGCAQMLMERDTPEDVKKDLRLINDSAEQMASVVQRLLTFGRQSKPGKQYVDINALVSRVIELRAREMSAHNIKVTTRLDPDLPCTMADVGQMQQVFLNIILNAEQAMTKANKGGHLLVETGQTRDRIKITFRDDGTGIPKEYLPRLFDPFFTTKDVGEGMGLGLSISYGIIQEHDGRIYAKKQSGKGATFVVELPIVAKPDQPESPEKPAEELREKVIGRILVVDDEPAICQLLKDLLTRDGHSVETVGDASVALEMLKRERFSLLLLDIRMKGMNGIELYQQMGEIAESLQRRVIFITGDTLARETRDFLDGAAAPHICKPFDIQQLRKMINQVLWSEG